MIKKLLLTLILVIMVIGQANAADLKNRFYVSQEYAMENTTNDTYYLIRDIETNTRYLVIKTYGNDFRAGNGIAITPLIKPAVYVHKGGKR